jgi:hypothetical protein
MMKVHYQFVTVGLQNSFRQTVIDTLLRRVEDLGIDCNEIDVLDSTNYFEKHANNAPTVALYFGGSSTSFPDQAILDDLILGAAYVLPVVQTLDGFSCFVPAQLSGINGFKLGSDADIEPLVAAILEGFSLLRNSRRLFISYKRSDSTGIAIQLYEELERAGFDVFLDTHSIRPGDPVQEELMHRMADTDVVVLLNSPGFLESFWTTEELAEASGMSIAILQLNWPGIASLDDSQLTIPISLQEPDFSPKGSADRLATLNPNVIQNLISSVEGLRARALAARQDNLTTEFKRVADKKSVPIELQPHKYFSLECGGRKKIIIPTIGVPQAFTYNQSDTRVKKYIASSEYDVFLLYDHKNIRELWLEHLSWLDTHLPVKSFKIVDAESWLTNNI